MEEKIAEECEFRILCALRRIIRAVDIYSRKLNSSLGLTAPQLLCLHALDTGKTMTLSQLTEKVNLSGSTVNGIVDRLEAKKYVLRQRSTRDRRKVYLHMTEAGKNTLDAAPSLLQDKLSAALAQLSELEQLTITQALERIVELMELGDLKTSPHLISAEEIDAGSDRR
ncbi:MAG: MarR family transcriptional regulator [Victivallales bacterium]|nr:MarR family transcriptional regulator [Victivallales bacterium]